MRVRARPGGYTAAVPMAVRPRPAIRRAPSTGTLQLIAGASLLAWAARRWLPRRGQVVYAAVVLAGLWIGFTITGWAAGTNLAARVDRVALGEPSDLGLLGMVSASTL